MKVKALSFRQPWAELVLQGRKTLDLRTWSTRFRGSLAIFASQTVEKGACLQYGLDPEGLSTGAIIGFVDLINVIELDQIAYDARTSQHLSGRHFQEPLFGWELANPRPIINPVPARGRLLLFDVDLPDDAEAPGQTPKQLATQSSMGYVDAPVLSVPPIEAEGSIEATTGNTLPFELRLTPVLDPKTKQASYRLGIYQLKLEPPSAKQNLYRHPPDQMERVVELGGVALRAVADQVLESLRENGYKATELSPNRREPFALQEESGVRLGLLFLAVKPVSKVSRIEVISAGIRQMTSEELYYWYSKCTSRAKADRAQKALRMLLADE